MQQSWLEGETTGFTTNCFMLATKYSGLGTFCLELKTKCPTLRTNSTTIVLHFVPQILICQCATKCISNPTKYTFSSTKCRFVVSLLYICSYLEILSSLLPCFIQINSYNSILARLYSLTVSFPFAQLKRIPKILAPFRRIPKDSFYKRDKIFTIISETTLAT